MSALRIALLAGLALTAVGCTETKEQAARNQAAVDRDLADALKGREPGQPQDCLSNFDMTNGPRVVGNSTILYNSGRTIWRTDVVCPGMRDGDTLIVELHGSQLCRNDRFRALTPGTSIPGPFCMMGQFTPYRKP